QSRRATRDRGQHELGLRRMRVAGHQVMLGQPHAVKAELVGELDLVRRLGVGARLVTPRAGYDGKLVEEIDLQARSPLGCGDCMISRIIGLLALSRPRTGSRAYRRSILGQPR